MRTNNAQPPSTLTPTGLRFDPLRQHPVNPALPVVLSGPGPDISSTRTIFLNHPFERLSPTLASSPRIVEADLTRRGSVHLDVRETETMHSRLIHGADFFDNSSESDSADSAGRLTRTYTETSGLGHRDRSYDMSNDDRTALPRGRNRHRSTTTMLSNVTSLPVNSADYSGVNEEHSASVVVFEDGNTPSHARKMSLTRLNRENVRLVDNRSIRSSIDSPRHSILGGYNNSPPVSPAYSAATLAAMFSASAIPGERSCKNANAEDTLTPLPQSPTFRNGYHRSSASDSTSSSDSGLADSIINAHVHTMRALEALGADPRSNEDVERNLGKEVERAAASRSYLNSGTTTSWPKSTTSLSENRRVRLSPLSTGTVISERGERRDGHDGATAHVPPASPYIDTTTTNPFATPLPATSPVYPEQTYSYNYTHSPLPNFSLSASDPSTRSTEDYARLDSACTSIFPEEVASCLPDQPKTAYNARKGKHVLGLVTASVESLDLRSRRERNESAQGLIRSRAEEGRGKDSKSQETGLVIWVGVSRWTWRVRKEMERGRGNNETGQGILEAIVIPGKLPDSDINDEKQGYRHQHPSRSSNNSDTDFDDAAFAERLQAANHRLVGRWFCFSARTLRGIRFGRRGVCCVGASMDNSERSGSGENPTTSTPPPPPPPPPPHPSETHLLALYKNPAIGFKKYMVVTWARRIAATREYQGGQKELYVPTLELVYTVSPTRVLVVMAVLLGFSVAAALAWVFLGHVGGGSEMTGPSQRVGSGMAIGVLVLLVEACGFGWWVAFS